MKAKPQSQDFWYEAVDVHLIVRDAVKEIVEKISEETEIKPLFGKP